MIPYVYVGFIVLSIGIIFSCTAALSYIFVGEFRQGFFIIFTDIMIQYSKFYKLVKHLSNTQSQILPKK